MTMKTLRLGSVFTAVLISLAVIFVGSQAARSAAGLSTTLPAPHLGYGLNVWGQPQIATGLGFDWLKLFEEAGPPPATALPYKVLYRVFVEGYPASLGTYLQHIHDLVQAGLGKVQAYEIGNEPNLSGDGFWGDQSVNPEAYAELVCAIYPVIKSVDPQALVVSAGLAPVGPWGPEYWSYVMDETVFAQRMLTRMQAVNNGQLCIDGFGYHPHGFAFTPETDYHNAPNGFAFLAERMHDLMVAAGLLKCRCGPRNSAGFVIRVRSVGGCKWQRVVVQPGAAVNRKCRLLVDARHGTAASRLSGARLPVCRRQLAVDGADVCMESGLFYRGTLAPHSVFIRSSTPPKAIPTAGRPHSRCGASQYAQALDHPARYLYGPGGCYFSARSPRRQLRLKRST
jgi:hypothetical protein